MALDNTENRYAGRHSNNRYDSNRSHNRGERSERDDNFRNRRGNRGYNNRFGDRRHEEHFESPQLDTPTCPHCKQPIHDLPSALADKATGEPMHFDCVLEILNKQEKLGTNEKITYIGQGRFAVAYFENPHDLRHFTIRRIIEWEERDKQFEWRTNIAGLYSQVK